MGSIDFMISHSLQRILAPFMARPDEELGMSELIQASAVGRGNVQRLVDKLVDAGLLTERRKGRYRGLSINKSFPFYPELRSIALKSFAIKEPITQALLPYARQIEEAFIFGSVAKGTDRASSDIDLILIGTPSMLDVSVDLAALEASLGRKINCNIYTRQEWENLRTTDHVLKQIDATDKMELDLWTDPRNTTTS